MTDHPVTMTVQPEVTPFFDEDSNTITYIVKDPASDSCAIIDSVIALPHIRLRNTVRDE